VDRITRKELKSDKFALEVGHTVEYVSEHRSQFVRYGSIAAAVLAVALGIYLYTRYRHGARQDALKSALRIQDAQVNTASGNEYILTFPNQAEKDKAAVKAFNDIISRYDGSDEAAIAHYYMGVIYADQGKPNDAEREFRNVADSGNDNYASLAKLSLSQILQAIGKQADTHGVQGTGDHLPGPHDLPGAAGRSQETAGASPRRAWSRQPSRSQRAERPALTSG
jgi:tetratricopeptide (TPR) repeat protein